MQEPLSGFTIMGVITNKNGFNPPIGFSQSGGIVDTSNFLNTESELDITAENEDDIILDQ
jgi:hypothetical protein